jgi:hypothetical protein
MFSRICAILLLIGQVPLMAKEQSGLVFDPAGPWAMEYADESCRLVREFASGETRLTLAFERFSLEPRFRLGLVGDGLRLDDRRRKEVSFIYVGQDEPRTSALLTTELADHRAAFLVTGATLLDIDPKRTADRKNLPPFSLTSELQREKEVAGHISSISFTRGFSGSFKVNLGSLASPIKAMQQCAEDLVASWNVDVAKFLAASRPAKAASDMNNWVRSEDYPEEMLEQNMGGLVNVRLVIGADGAIEKCMVSVGKQGAFEKLVCDNLGRRAKFEPARDAEGKPFRSYWIGNWHFGLK